MIRSIIRTTFNESQFFRDNNKAKPSSIFTKDIE